MQPKNKTTVASKIRGYFSGSKNAETQSDPDPKSEIFDGFKKAIEAAGDLATGDGRFALACQEMRDLQEYTQAGFQLPNSNDAFETRHPQAVIEKYLKACSAEDWKTLYTQLRKYTIAISLHCGDFEEKTLGRIGNVGGNVATFAEDARPLIIYLIKQLETICSSNDEGAIQTACAKAQTQIQELRDGCKRNEQDCKEVQNQMIKFRIETIEDKANLEPCVKKLSNTSPKLNDDIRDMIYKLDGNRVEVLGKEAEVVEKTLQGAPFKMFTLILKAVTLTLPAMVNKDAAQRLRANYNAFQEYLIANRDSHGKMFAVQVEMALYTDLLVSVVSKMDKAIEAMQKINTAFGTMSTKLDGLEQKLRRAKENVVQDIEFAVQGLNDMLPVWDNVKQAAERFQKDPLA